MYEVNSKCLFPNKIKHRSFMAASNAIVELEKTQGIDLRFRPYPCDDHWHIGHKHSLNSWERKYSHKRFGKKSA